MSYDAFLSYAHHDDEEERPITSLCEKLQRFVGKHLGRDARIFHDNTELRVGQEWEKELESALRCPCLVPVITPAYLRSDNCVHEFLRFADYKSRNGEVARILPLYYIEVPAIEDQLGRPSKRPHAYGGDQSRVVKFVLQRQLADLRWWHKSPQRVSDEGMGALDELAREIAVAVERVPARKTITVCPEGGDYSTISSAIRRAEPGYRIHVKHIGNHKYQECLFVDKPLEIVGESGVTLIGLGGPAITCVGSPVRIARMKIKAEEFNSVIISGGYCVLEESEVEGAPHSRNSGVLVRDAAEATVIDCSLHNAQHCGLHARDKGTKCNVVSSRVTRNHTGGLFFSHHAEGVVDGNLIESNKYNGIYIAAEANPRVRRNRIRGHANAGILVYLHEEWADCGPGRGIIEDNEITEGKEFGIQIQGGANPCVRRNTIKRNAWGGIRTLKDGRGKIYNNRILNNGGSGIKNEGGRPRIGINEFSGNGGQEVEDHGGAVRVDHVRCDEQPDG